MADHRETGERSSSEQPPSSIKMEQVRTIPGGALVRTLPPQQRFIMTPSTALIQASSTTTIQAQVVPKVTVQGASSNVGRISAVPMQSAATSTGGFHVPKGPAAVANITVPRSSNVAAPMVRGTSLQAISVAPHTIPGSIATTAGTMQIGRSVVSSVAPWVGISSAQQSNIPRQTTHIRPAIQQITEHPYYPCTPPHSKPYPRSRATPKYVNEAKSKNTLVSYDNSSSDEDSDPLPSNLSSLQKAYHRLVSYNSSDEESTDPSNGSKISGQVRPLDQRMLVHSSTTHKQVITQQAQVQLTAGGNDPSKGQTTVLKSYSGASAAARLIAPPSAQNLSRIVPSAMVSLHSAAVLVPNSQGIPVKTTVAQPKVITQPVHSSTSVQFPAVSSATVQPALALNTVQVSRPALVTVMLSPSVAAGAGSQPQGVTHIKPHPSGGPQIIQQSSGGGLSQGSSTVGKLYADGPHTITATSQPVFIQTQGSLSGQVSQKTQLPAALIVREPPRSKEELVSSAPSGVNLHSGTVYSLTGGSYYDGPSYIKVPQQHQSLSSNMTASSGPQQPSLHIRQTATQMPSISPSISVPSSQGLRVNPMMVVDGGRTQISPFTSSVDSSTSMSSSDTNMAALALTSQALKQTTSPRPSILRKREPEGSPIKVTKNLAPVLSGITVSASSPPCPPGSPPKRPESGQSGVSSSGSTTVSANSSPGESPTATLKQENVDDEMATPAALPVTSGAPTIMTVATSRPQILHHPPPTSSAHQTEMSPRKKPRKQQLSGNQIASEPTFSEDEMEFITDDKVKRDTKEEPPEDAEKAAPKKTMSLLSAYKHNWKGRNNHFNRYTDVKPKEERKPTLSEIANQKNVAQKLTGWKVYHIATHLEDLANSETEFFSEYNSTLSFLEDKLGKCRNRETEKDFHRITERVRANYQRSRVVKDHMIEARSQLFKLLEHKSYISDIINRNTIKRPLKKRERL
uniref:Histone deacetylase complex subunit SAP130 C-terminal domain-containing protein n=2 Tax=Lygus hesperus TaxID=30085 RepID=A0A0A9YQB9_LYGHE